MKKYKVYRRKFGKTVFLILKILLAIIVVSGAYYGISKTDYFKISDVKVNGAKNFVSSNDLKELAVARVQGKLIFRFEKDSLKESLLRDFQGAGDIKISRKLPSTVVVDVYERVPLAVVKDSHSNHFLVDDDGYVLGRVDPSKTNLPIVNYEGEISVGYVLHPEIVKTFLSLLNILDKHKILVTGLSINKEHLTFFVDSGSTEVIVSNEKNKEDSIETLGNLLEKLASEGKEPGLIDLRYDKVVVSYR